jgi:hypothetical protein
VSTNFSVGRGLAGGIRCITYYTTSRIATFILFIYKPVVLYGFDTWSLILREEHRLRVFENRVLRRIFRPKRDKVTGDWRKLHNEELYNLVLLAKRKQNDQVKEDEMGRACSTNGEKRDPYRILVGKPEEKGALRRPRSRWVDNIKVYLREIIWDGMDRIDLAQDRERWRALVNTVMNLRIS